MRPRRHWAGGWNIAKPDAVLRDAAAGPTPGRWRCGVHLRNRAHALHAKTDGCRWSEVRPSQPRICASRGGVHSTAGFQLAAPCTRGGPSRPQRLAIPQDRSRRAWNHQRPAASLCAGQFAGSVGPRDGKIRPCGLRPSIFRCTTPPNGMPARTRPASASCLRNAARSSACSRCSSNDHLLSFRPARMTFVWKFRARFPMTPRLLGLFPHMHLRGRV